MDATGLTVRILATLNRLKSHSGGTTVVEFALVVPVFIALVVGGLYACLGVFTETSLQYAVEQAARCASVSSNCSSSSTTIAYAKSAYNGPVSPAPAFTYSTPACGYSVSGTVSFVFNFGLSQKTVPISASACFP